MLDFNTTQNNTTTTTYGKAKSEIRFLALLNPSEFSPRMYKYCMFTPSPLPSLKI